ncbi:MAG: transcription antitermination factor NusB [Deltaproteobacteria bacterium]|nr:MAG: transcription antitermination factor NusB [Deltaproteobacteria bacterium]
MGKRRRSRELALQALYQRDITGQEGVRGLAQLREHLSPEEGDDEFADRLVRGVLEHGQEIDQVIEEHSENWRLERMPAVDRNILRIATFELLHCEEIPPKATLNEAIQLGKRFGSEESGSFINGILDRILSRSVTQKPSQNEKCKVQNAK